MITAITANGTVDTTAYQSVQARNSGLSVTTHDPNDRRLAIQVQPNPTSEKLVVQLNSPGSVDTHFEILSTRGQLMYSTSIPSKLGKNTMDLGQLHLSSGTYVLTATQAGGFQQRISFIWKYARSPVSRAPDPMSPER
ncbi:MAG: T9SS type A sorting domain-containing protein [Bacteroidetes bacterium]|nr:T9SS type A sorting domain-containing protein [Bacteroidota bacterium]MDA0899129.1 T9SS type A sorting domain-containing protein [Bacteroidota bacterium]